MLLPFYMCTINVEVALGVSKCFYFYARVYERLIRLFLVINE